ncbi:MAG: urease accessory protein UreF [Rhizobacter sp.]|jgi:urease accessory protein
MQVAASPRPGGAAAQLQLMWLASPALPVGGFSYSEGLEAAVETGRVAAEAECRAWLIDQLHLSLARSELAVAAAAFQAWGEHDLPRITELNDWVAATRESAEGRLQTEQMGRSLVEWMRNRPEGLVADDRLAHLMALRPAPTWPVGFALAGVQAGADVEGTLLSFAFGWAENMVQAALKAVPLGQAAGQRVLSGLVAEIPAAIATAQTVTDADRQAFCPMLAILQSQHETQYSRLFRS